MDANPGANLKDKHVHYQIPQKFRDEFKKYINIDDPKYLEAVNSQLHNANSRKYNELLKKMLIVIKQIKILKFSFKMLKV
jgi:hypothetical protein